MVMWSKCLAGRPICTYVRSSSGPILIGTGPTVSKCVILLRTDAPQRSDLPLMRVRTSVRGPTQGGPAEYQLHDARPNTIGDMDNSLNTLSVGGRSCGLAKTQDACGIKTRNPHKLHELSCHVSRRVCVVGR